MDLSTKDFSLFITEAVFLIYTEDLGIMGDIADLGGAFVFLLVMGILEASLYSGYSRISFLSFYLYLYFYFYLTGSRIGG